MEGVKGKLDELGVEMIYVYTREPHAGQRMRGFDFSGEPQTKSVEERLANAALCRKKYSFSIRWVVDGMDCAIQDAYGGLPNSGFLIRSDRVVVCKQAWADAAALAAEAQKLRPPAWYTAGEDERKLLLRIYEAALKARKSKTVEGRVSALRELAGSKHQAALPRVGSCLGDPEPEVRKLALELLKAMIDGLPAFDPDAPGAERSVALDAVNVFLRAAEKNLRFDASSCRFAKKGMSSGEEGGGGKDGQDGHGGGNGKDAGK